MKNQGFVYACSHDLWLEETIRSALSVKKAMPDMERELYITENIIPPSKTVLESAFTKVVAMQNSAFAHRPRFESCLMTTLDRAIFLDGDTLILRPCYELFPVLDDFDIALCIAPQLHHSMAIEKNMHSFLPFVSMAVAEFNAGMIVAKKTEKFGSFVKSWMHLFEICLSHQYRMDQVALRVALAKSDLRIATLPNNYNFRANVIQSVAGVVKILHCHGELEEIGQIVNQKRGIRLYQAPAHLVHGGRPRRKEM